MKTKLALFTAVVTSLAYADAKLFTIELNGYPKVAKTCQETAQVVGREFEAATGLKVVNAKCVREKWSSYDISFGYSAEKKADLTRMSDWPVYASYEACQQSLAKERAEFAALTGLNPFLVHCAYFLEQTGFKNYYRYTAEAFVFGKTKAVPVSVRLNMYDGQYRGGNVLAQEIVEKSKVAGLPVVAAYLDSREWEADLWIRLVYPDLKSVPKGLSEDFHLSHTITPFLLGDPFGNSANPLRMESLDQCAKQSEIAKKTFGTFFPEPQVWFCMWNPNLFYAQLYQLRIGTSDESVERLTPGEDGEPIQNLYSTHEACEANKPLVEAHYKKKFGANYVGALCSWPIQTRPKVPTQMFVYIAN